MIVCWPAHKTAKMLRLEHSCLLSLLGWFLGRFGWRGCHLTPRCSCCLSQLFPTSKCGDIQFRLLWLSHISHFLDRFSKYKSAISVSGGKKAPHIIESAANSSLIFGLQKIKSIGEGKNHSDVVVRKCLLKQVLPDA